MRKTQILTWPTNPVQYGLTANNLSLGTYYVLVQDVNIECDNASLKVDVTEAATIDIISDRITENVSCLGKSDGIPDIHISGGVESYLMNWSNGESDTLLELGEDVQISFLTNSTDFVDFNWMSRSTTFDCDTCPLFNFLPLETTGFNINLIEETNECKGSGEAIIRLTESSYIFVPNIFTPNDDGFNDKLNVFAQSATIASINYLRIYNRWGL